MARVTDRFLPFFFFALIDSRSTREIHPAHTNIEIQFNSILYADLSYRGYVHNIIGTIHAYIYNYIYKRIERFAVVPLSSIGVTAFRRAHGPLHGAGRATEHSAERSAAAAADFGGRARDPSGRGVVRRLRRLRRRRRTVRAARSRAANNLGERKSRREKTKKKYGERKRKMIRNAARTSTGRCDLLLVQNNSVYFLRRRRRQYRYRRRARKTRETRRGAEEKTRCRPTVCMARARSSSVTVCASARGRRAVVAAWRQALGGGGSSALGTGRRARVRPRAGPAPPPRARGPPAAAAPPPTTSSPPHRPAKLQYFPGRRLRRH